MAASSTCVSRDIKRTQKEFKSIIIQALDHHPSLPMNHHKYFLDSKSYALRRQHRVLSYVLHKSCASGNDCKDIRSTMPEIEHRLKGKKLGTRRNARTQHTKGQFLATISGPSRSEVSRGNYNISSEVNPSSKAVPIKTSSSISGPHAQATPSKHTHLMTKPSPLPLSACTATLSPKEQQPAGREVLLGPSMTRRRIASNRPALQRRLSLKTYREFPAFNLTVSPALALLSPDQCLSPITPVDQLIHALRSPPELPRPAQAKPQLRRGFEQDAYPTSLAVGTASPTPGTGSPTSPLCERASRLSLSGSPTTSRLPVRRRLSYSLVTPQSRSAFRSPHQARLATPAYLASPLDIHTSFNSPLDTPIACPQNYPLPSLTSPHGWFYSPKHIET
ncbi:hypothetical protein HGRIS_013262 [Hohenbuehelia grisea]|uniref:Uncharacterized protein n=1 Tax=Hohenbuehelia grisea TaxID=104357 RepID=A0ABR3IV64_9AGAR